MAVWILQQTEVSPLLFLARFLNQHRDWEHEHVNDDQEDRKAFKILVALLAAVKCVVLFEVPFVELLPVLLSARMILITIENLEYNHTDKRVYQ